MCAEVGPATIQAEVAKVTSLGCIERHSQGITDALAILQGSQPFFLQHLIMRCYKVQTIDFQGFQQRRNAVFAKGSRYDHACWMAGKCERECIKHGKWL